MALIQGEPDAARRKAHWEALIVDLKVLPPAGQRFYESIFMPVLTKTFSAGDDLRGVLEALLEIYPGRLKLRVALARSCERLGASADALAHFQAAINIAESTERNLESLKQESLAELRSWVDALQGRLRAQSG